MYMCPFTRKHVSMSIFGLFDICMYLYLFVCEYVCVYLCSINTLPVCSYLSINTYDCISMFLVVTYSYLHKIISIYVNLFSD